MPSTVNRRWWRRRRDDALSKAGKSADINEFAAIAAQRGCAVMA